MARKSSMGRLIRLICVGQLFFLATTLPLKAEETDSTKSATEPTVSVTETPDTGAVGIASYYAKRYNGRRTTSGLRYDPKKLTAAHQSLPFGTKVKVVNLANNREVIVTVTDRCRKRRGPFIDLSRAAAQQLGFFGKGIAKVVITPLVEDPA